MKFRTFPLLTALICLCVSPLGAAQLNTGSTLADTLPPAAAPVQATTFDPVIDDLPLMAGLNPLPDEGAVFAAPPAGRIAESVTQGMVDIDDVYRFYHRTLPHLGWQIIDGRTYHRKNERLRIDAHAGGKVTTVRFSITPE